MADGSIIIDTRIDTGGVSKGMNAVKAGMARISAQVSKMGDSAKSSFQRQITAITGLYQNYEKQERKVSELKSKLEELSKVRIETEEYKKLKDDIKALEDEFEKVETKQREWLDMGFSIDSAPLQELDKQMDDIWADIDRLQRKQKEMQTTGRAYVDPTSTDKSVIRKLSEKHPDDCQIIADNEDGSICAHVPVAWIRISPPKQYTEEQRQQMGERMRQNRSENTATQG